MSALTPEESAIGRDPHQPMRLPKDLEEYIQRWLKMQGQPVPKQIIVLPARWTDNVAEMDTYSYLAGLYGELNEPDEWRPL